MRTDCKEIAAFVSDYVDDCLDPRKRDRVSAHVESCEHCRLEVEKTRRLVMRLSGLGKERAPIDLWQGASTRIARIPSSPGVMRRIASAARWKIIAVPAAAAAVLFMLNLYEQPQSQPQASAEYRAYMQAYSRFRSQQALADSGAIAAATQLQRREAVPQ